MKIKQALRAGEIFNERIPGHQGMIPGQSPESCQINAITRLIENKADTNQENQPDQPGNTRRAGNHQE